MKVQLFVFKESLNIIRYINLELVMMLKVNVKNS